MTLDIDDARALGRSSSVPLVVLTLRCGAVLRVSDRATTVGGNNYDPLLMNSPTVSESVNREDSSAINSDCTLVLSNESMSLLGTVYSSLVAAHDAYPLAGAAVTLSHVLRDGSQETAEVLQFVGVTDEPSDISEKSLSLRCSSRAQYRARIASRPRLDASSFAAARPDDYGRAFPIVMGVVPAVEVVRSEFGAATTLSAAADNSQTTITVTSTAGFASAGTIVIDAEWITYTGITATSFTGCTRGYSTSDPAAHALGARAYVYQASYVGVVADHGIDSIGSVYGAFSDGLLAFTGATVANTTYGGKTRAVLTKAAPLPLQSTGGPVLDRVFVDVNGMESDDAIYGTVGSVVARPDYVMKKYLTAVLGYAAADIDSTSFDIAGAWYAANNYALSVLVTDENRLAALYRMAYECRSVIWESAGKWYLLVLPDVCSPVVREIARGDFDPDRPFSCGYTRADQVCNYLTVRHSKINGPAAANNLWQGSVVLSDVRPLEDTVPGMLDLRYVRSAAMASSVGGLALKQRRQSYKTISFPVFWQHTDLQIGDSVTISGLGFWEGVKFWINGETREGINRGTFNAIEWWG